MKVFHLMSGAPYGGVERQAERLAGVLRRNGVEQRVMLAANPARAKRFEAMGLQPVEMEFPSRFAFLDRRRINSVIGRFGPDIVISWTPDVAELVQKENFVHMARLGTSFDHAALLNKCHHIFTPSQARADSAMVAGWSVQQVHVLPHLPMTDEETRSPPVNRKTIYTPPTAKLIFTSMRLTSKAGLETLLDALARISGYYLWIAGDGADREALETAAHERGVKPRVRFLGWQDNLAPYLAACDMFIYPARNDDVGDAVPKPGRAVHRLSPQIAWGPDFSSAIRTTVCWCRSAMPSAWPKPSSGLRRTRASFCNCAAQALKRSMKTSLWIK